MAPDPRSFHPARTVAQRAQARRARVPVQPGRRRGVIGSLVVHGVLAAGLAIAVEQALTPLPVEPAPALPPLVFAVTAPAPEERETLPPLAPEAVPDVAVSESSDALAVVATPEIDVAEVTVRAAEAEPTQPTSVLTSSAPNSGLGNMVCAAVRRPRGAPTMAAPTAPVATIAATGAASGTASTPAQIAGPTATVQVVERVSPVYPRQARRQGLEGIVRLDVTVDEHGEVIAVAVAGTSGHTLLDEAAQEAVRHWRFTPAIPAAEQVRIVIRFALT